MVAAAIAAVAQHAGAVIVEMATGIIVGIIRAWVRILIGTTAGIAIAVMMAVRAAGEVGAVIVCGVSPRIGVATASEAEMVGGNAAEVAATRNATTAVVVAAVCGRTK